MKKCLVCDRNFVEIDEVVSINDEFYHSKCVDFAPIKWAVFRHDDEFIGVAADDDKGMAFDLMDEGDYIE